MLQLSLQQQTFSCRPHKTKKATSCLPNIQPTNIQLTVTQLLVVSRTTHSETTTQTRERENVLVDEPPSNTCRI